MKEFFGAAAVKSHNTIGMSFFVAVSESRILRTMRCQLCGHELAEGTRFCTHCGTPGGRSAPADRETEELNLPVLYGMAILLVLAVLFPPWENPPGTPPRFLGFHFVLNAPASESGGPGTAVISRLLVTVEVVTVAVGGLYFSWLFRKKK